MFSDRFFQMQSFQARCALRASQLMLLSTGRCHRSPAMMKQPSPACILAISLLLLVAAPPQAAWAAKYFDPGPEDVPLEVPLHIRRGRSLASFEMVQRTTRAKAPDPVTGQMVMPDETEADTVYERVDYRFRPSSMVNLRTYCSGASSGQQCGPCSQLPHNPCNVLDGFGTDTSLCMLPDFLGGTIPESQMCGVGTAVDVHAPDAAPGDGPAARLVLFR